MTIMSQSTSMTNGVTNAAPWQAMAESGIPDPSWSQLLHDEFNRFAATDYTLTATSSGSAALTPEVGGVLNVLTAATTVDSTFMQVPVASFQLLAGTHHFFKARLRLASVTTADCYAGLIATGTSPIAAPVNGLFFFKATGAATWVLRSVVAGVTVDYPLPASAVMVNATWAEVSFHVGTAGEVEVFFNPTTGGPFTVIPVGAVRGRAALIPAGSALPTVVMAPSFGVRNSAAAAVSTFSVDYITVSSEL